MSVLAPYLLDCQALRILSSPDVVFWLIVFLEIIGMVAGSVPVSLGMGALTISDHSFSFGQ